MNLNFYVVIEILLEVLFLPFLSDPLVLIFLIINGLFMARNLYILFSKTEDSTDTLLDYKETSEKENNTLEFKEILKIDTIQGQVELFFKNFNFDIHYLQRFLTNLSDEEQITFLDTLIVYCRNIIASTSNTPTTIENATLTLSIAIKYKTIIKRNSKVTKNDKK